MFTFSDEGVTLGAHVHQTKKMWLQGLHPKFVIALNTQPRRTTDWMREQYRRQAEQLEEPATDPMRKLPAGAPAAFRNGMQQIEFHFIACVVLVLLSPVGVIKLLVHESSDILL